MDRVTVYPGQIPLETDVLRTNKFGMMAVAKLAAAMLGTSTVVNGLACVPTSPASLQVNVNPGEMYSLVNVDATAYSSLAADTTHSILKQGISLDAVALNCPAPATGGQSINYLIQATYQDTDTDNVALPYYNASNPSQAWSGPNNTGTPQSTTRKGAVVISAKAGTAATTGTQTTPAPDSGYTGLWVVTVANGQSTITAGNITQATNAPILPADLLHSIQQNALTSTVDVGSANTYVVNYSPAIQALTNNMVLFFEAKTANNGASTLNVNGLGAIPLVGGAHAALQGGEIVAGGKCMAIYKTSINSAILIECTGGAVQIAPATQSQHAMQLGQAVGRYIGARVFTTSQTYTPTSGTTSVVVELVGGGGGGGGTFSTGGGQVSTGTGGGSGSYIRARFTSGFSGLSMTIGAAGSAGAIGGAGGAGGTTSFGALASAPGGLGGGAGPSGVAPPYVQYTSNGASAPSGANINGASGSNGDSAIASGVGSFKSGGGGASYFGPGGSAIGTATQNGVAASTYGAGGGGGATGSGVGTGNTGGAGAAGVVIVHEYS